MKQGNVMLLDKRKMARVGHSAPLALLLYQPAIVKDQQYATIILLYQPAIVKDQINPTLITRPIWIYMQMQRPRKRVDQIYQW